MNYTRDKIWVTKRDGSKEEYHPDKIIQVLEAAGLEVAPSIQIAQSVTTWIETRNSPEVTSAEIRDQVLVKLDQINPQIANLYRWYQKTKD